MENSQKNDIIFYSTPDGNVKIEVLYNDETFWLTQKRMAELFGCTTDNISLHLRNIFKDGELDQNSVTEEISATAADGKNYKTNFYNLDAIIAVGYRVNSLQATQFRIWATKTLREFIVKGFVMDDERLKQGALFGKDYFDELLDRIREIRASERRFYLKITDIYEQCSIDYNKTADITQKFFKTVQNKLHWAITGETAAELIAHRANALKPNMGLQTWKNSPNGRILKSDTVIAKNYLSEQEIKSLERSVGAFFDYIERIIENHNTFTMEQFANSVNKFMEFNEYKILEGKGKISARQAEDKAFAEYDKFNKTQKIESDFDKAVKALKNRNLEKN